jgi:hypothetical protein
MFRTLYALSVVALIGGTAWSAMGMQPARTETGSVGIVLLSRCSAEAAKWRPWPPASDDFRSSTAF